MFQERDRNDSELSLNLLMSSGGSGHERLLFSKFLGIDKRISIIRQTAWFFDFFSAEVTYRTLRFDSFDRASGSSPVKLLFDKSLRFKLNLL